VPTGKKHLDEFYEDVNKNCRRGSIFFVIELLHIRWPGVPETSLKTFIARARRFGDCRMDYPRKIRAKDGKVRTIKPQFTADDILSVVTMDQIVEALLYKMREGIAAIERVKDLEVKLSDYAIKNAKLEQQVKTMAENGHKTWASALAVKEGLLHTAEVVSHG
jgi:hypothetical protein